MRTRVSAILLALAAAILVAAPPAQAQWWQHHPGYLHAMSDLRSAYWLVQHRDPDDDRQMYREEQATLGDIRNAYEELKNASIVDNKDIDDQPPAQTNFYDHRGRLNRALDLLRKARTDISVEEDDPEARGLRNKAIMHINYGINHLKDSIDYWHY